MAGPNAAAGTVLKYTASVYGPYLAAPAYPGLDNEVMQRTDGYKQVYGSKEHHRFCKNPSKTAYKLL